ncbi:hypothetical protein FQN54_005012 [Arachnomyces sp. PD_36]|nr:hypothetical protein FQN54_005012 [Arachnomyces sp. PD_36]
MPHHTLEDYGAQATGETCSFTGGSFLSRPQNPDPYLPAPVGSGASIDAESHFLQRSEPHLSHGLDTASPWRFGMAPTLNPLHLSANQVFSEASDRLALESDLYLHTPSPPDSLPSLSQSRTFFNDLNEYACVPEEHTMPRTGAFQSSDYAFGDNSPPSNQTPYPFPPMSESWAASEYPPCPRSIAYGPPSPATSLSSTQSRDINPLLHASARTLDAVPEANNALPQEMDEDCSSTEEPYARLIYKALSTAPGNRMVLREIYEWFEKNTTKAKNSDTKGWQNSIRHNLSMNAAFEGVKDASSPGEPSRKSGNAWMLTEKARREGVQSTTRYRKQGIHKKTAKSEHPAPQRQRSGAKGGRAAKKTAQLRRERRDETIQFKQETIPDSFRTATVPVQGLNPTYGQTMSPATPTLNIPADAFDYTNVGGCVDLVDDSPLFYTDSETGEETFFSKLAFPNEHELDPSFNHIGL